MLPWLLYLLFLVIELAALLLNIIAMPGLWLMLAAAMIYAWLTGLAFVGKETLIVLLLLAAVGEVVEIYVGTAGTRRAGGGRPAMAGAIAGGILGRIFLSLIPIPIISTLVGVCAGSFLGAAVMELYSGGSLDKSIRVGAGAATGRAMGIVAKLLIGGLMLLILTWQAMPWGGRRVAVPPPATSPARNLPA
jgi:uncharacterized protein YqgC (DUF456 family)